MDGLDLLKQHWQKDSNFPKIDKEEIRVMRHKSSSSIVKWIFIISVIELVVGFVMGLFVNTERMDQYPHLSVIYQVYAILFQIIIIYFIYRFFKSYATIRNTKNTNVLLKNILSTRQQVNNYIKFNIYCFAIVFLLVIVEETVMKLQTRTEEGQMIVLLITVLFLVIFGILFILLMKFYYKLLYQRLLKKLNANYEELNRLETDEE
ncbi:hypothetical protein [Sphingobacterium sp. MYb382]|uniref:hypothetical protein n=1 Tax=Sphingobacterium sp. MYb382 TaxID=2745278 RepID=UPI0030A8A585